MYFNILDGKTNKPIFMAELTHFSTHTSATESLGYEMYKGRWEHPVAFNVILKSAQILNEEALLEFEKLHRLDNTEMFVTSSGKQSEASEKREFYVFVQPKLRDKFHWNITQTAYRVP